MAQCNTTGAEPRQGWAVQARPAQQVQSPALLAQSVRPPAARRSAGPSASPGPNGGGVRAAHMRNGGGGGPRRCWRRDAPRGACRQSAAARFRV